MQDQNHLIVIAGPTAIGKTALSIEIAKDFSCDIVSCDSRQFYQEMTIGTAVPDAEELASVTHHFIQNKSIHDDYSVGDYEREAIGLLEALFKKNKVAVLVGGSGLFLDAVLYGFDSFPDIDPLVREQVRMDYQEKGIGFLQAELRELDPLYFETVDRQNPQRLMRALEVCRGTGKTYSSFRTSQKTKRNFQPILIGLDAPRDLIYDRINRRVDIMMENGLLAEASALYPMRKLNALQTVGYRELFEYLDGKLTLEEAVAEIKKNTRRFAKRQLTWFRRNPEIQWFDTATDFTAVRSYLLEQMAEY